MKFIDITNKVLLRLNEVPLKSDTWGSARGFHNMAKDAVNAALFDINNVDFEWPFNHETWEETLTPGTQIYALPEDCKSVDWDTFHILKDTNATPLWQARALRYTDYDNWAQRTRADDENASTGSTPEFVFRTQNLEWGVTPKPDKAYVAQYEYWKIPVDLSKFDDEPTVPDQFVPVIVNGAMYYCYLFRENTDAAQLADSRFKDGQKNMRSIMVNRYTDVRSGQIPGRG